MKNNLFIEEFSFCETGYDFKEFEGIKIKKSDKYDFKVDFYNSKDFRYKGNIEYKIYIPYSFLEEKTGLSSEKEYEDLFSGKIIETNKGVDIDSFNNLLNEIRLDIEQEIFEY